jgi:hypothetical protein
MYVLFSFMATNSDSFAGRRYPLTPNESERFDPEDIKQSIVDADNRYYLQPSKKPGANYKVLFCRLPGFKREGRRVKVDILIPLTPPKVLLDDVWLIKNIPVMPLFDLLVMKMQGGERSQGFAPFGLSC